MVMWGGYVWVLYRVGEADTRLSGSFQAALYAARPPDKARQKVAPTTDSITLPPALRK